LKRFKSLNIFFIIGIISLSQNFSFAQYFSISGSIVDSITHAPIVKANVALYQLKDTSNHVFTVTDINGKFEFKNLQQNIYKLKATHVSHKPYTLIVRTTKTETNLGTLKMRTYIIALRDAVIVGKEPMAVQKEDTIEYNSKAFKTHPDATTEDLITKMPGVTSDNGTVKVNGEQVQQVLVDGKPFFGDDPNLTLKNLPAEIVDKIQVFDKLSDQSQFTGFDDGQSVKTMNIVTRQNKNEGQFGKIYTGYGTDDHYIAGGNINLFKGNRRFSIIGLTNNVNQQNFGTQDLLGITGNSGGGRGGGGGGFGGRGGGGGGGNFGGVGGVGGNSINNFLVGQQNGIATTNAIGMNYSDNWGKKIKITASYFFNNADNKNSTTLTRNYITAKDSGLFYNEKSASENNNYNHRFNLRFEYTIDSSNSLIITPKLNWQKNNASSSVNGANTRLSAFVSQTDNQNISDNSGYNFSNNLLFRHKFNKKGRTISLNLGTELNNKTGNGNLYSSSQYYNLNDTTTTLINQQSDQKTNGYTISPSVVYTEPIGKKGQLQINYSPSLSRNNTDKETSAYDTIIHKYLQLDTTLSNKYSTDYIVNRGGLSCRLNAEKYSLNAGLNYQYATLSGDETFPAIFKVNKTFEDFLPQAMLNYKFSKSQNLRIMYRASTNVPSVSQLQNVINNSNPLLLSTGNSDLKQDYEQSLTVRYGKTNSVKATTMFIFLYANYAQNYIGNSIFIPYKKTVIDGITLNSGSQLTKPVNIDGYWNTRSFFTYGLPIAVSKIKCNLNLSTGLTYSKTPVLINNYTNLSNNYNLCQSLVLSSNISEKTDFTFSYTGNYSVVQNTLKTQSNNTYYYQVVSFKLNKIFLKRFVFNTNINHSLYSGLSQSYNQNFLLWNASIAYKLLKNQALEIKFSVADILDQNKAINRTITETYIEDSQTKALTRYFMFTLTYNLRKFKGNPTENKNK